MKKLLTLPAALLLYTLLFISGCGPKEDCLTCCEPAENFGKLTPPDYVQPFYPFTGSTDQEVFYYYLPGVPQRVQFFIAGSSNDVCTDEHLSIDYYVKTRDVAFDRPVKIFGEVYWSAYSDEIILLNNVPPANTELAETLSDVGLKQAFPEGAASIDVYTTVEFESLGSLDLDTAYLKQHFQSIRYYYNYKKF
ncbi:MAG: hypothetical protein POELPBGB_01750 [Bacteroidia bacterium]|nr:hypothetical protein [Bacteroidia bacterium]